MSDDIIPEPPPHTDYRAMDAPNATRSENAQVFVDYLRQEEERKPLDWRKLNASVAAFHETLQPGQGSLMDLALSAWQLGAMLTGNAPTKAEIREVKGTTDEEEKFDSLRKAVTDAGGTLPEFKPSLWQSFLGAFEGQSPQSHQASSPLTAPPVQPPPLPTEVVFPHLAGAQVFQVEQPPVMPSLLVSYEAAFPSLPQADPSQVPAIPASSFQVGTAPHPPGVRSSPGLVTPAQGNAAGGVFSSDPQFPATHGMRNDIVSSVPPKAFGVTPESPSAGGGGDASLNGTMRELLSAVNQLTNKIQEWITSQGDGDEDQAESVENRRVPRSGWRVVEDTKSDVGSGSIAYDVPVQAILRPQREPDPVVAATV